LFEIDSIWGEGERLFEIDSIWGEGERLFEIDSIWGEGEHARRGREFIREFLFDFGRGISFREGALSGRSTLRWRLAGAGVHSGRRARGPCAIVIAEGARLLGTQGRVARVAGGE